MLNKVILIGRLVADPQLRYTQSGIAVTNFTLAVDRPFVSQDGQREADFIDIVTWRKLAEVCANHLNKGRLVAVEGRLQIRSYDDQNGIRRKASEIVADNVRFLDRAQDSGSYESADGPPEPEFDDIPF
ncbi:MAG: single-stranded DNA-binding protein [Bacillota bacterium]|nr:single-stranded DNA-binding protein [Bacillota bacterium]NLJ02795.1 single-stranded DNA-binding protein [Bacillota bacterium]